MKGSQPYATNMFLALSYTCHTFGCVMVADGCEMVADGCEWWFAPILQIRLQQKDSGICAILEDASFLASGLLQTA